jgi:hypothetical protein
VHLPLLQSNALAFAGLKARNAPAAMIQAETTKTAVRLFIPSHLSLRSGRRSMGSPLPTLLSIAKKHSAPDYSFRKEAEHRWGPPPATEFYNDWAASLEHFEHMY